MHAGEVVDINHRRNLFQVVVGSEGVRLAKLVEELEAKKSELNAPIRTSKQTVEAAVPHGMTLAKFLALEPDPGIERHIENAERAVGSAQKSKELCIHKGFVPLAMPSLPADTKEVLGLTLDDVSEDAERRLTEHVEHLADPDDQRWLSHGVALVKDDRCPFCPQGVCDNDLVRAYKACFSQSYGSAPPWRDRSCLPRAAPGRRRESFRRPPTWRVPAPIPTHILMLSCKASTSDVRPCRTGLEAASARRVARTRASRARSR